MKIAGLEVENKKLETRLAKRELALSKVQKEMEERGDVTIVISEKNEKIIQLSKEKKKLLEDLEALADHLVAQEKKTTAAQLRIQELMMLVKDKDVEIQRLMSRSYFFWYFPVRDDKIDCALANFLNCKDAPPPVPFVRESKGFYVFGTKKVELRLEMDHLIGKPGEGVSQHARGAGSCRSLSSTRCICHGSSRSRSGSLKRARLCTREACS